MANSASMISGKTYGAGVYSKVINRLKFMLRNFSIVFSCCSGGRAGCLPIRMLEVRSSSPLVLGQDAEL